jgi:hypothetical protein
LKLRDCWVTIKTLDSRVSDSMEKGQTDLSIYEVVRDNYKEVKKALVQIERATNRAIREGDNAAAVSLTKVQMLFVSIKAEAAMLQVLYLPNLVTKAIRDSILDKPTALDQWRATVDACFRHHYHIKNRTPLEVALAHDVLAKRNTLHELITTELAVMISIRNKLAHGYFSIPLNSERIAVESSMVGIIAAENALTLKYRDNLIEELVKALMDLALSPKTFERLFDKRYAAIRENRAHLKVADYEKWCTQIKKTHVPFPILAKNFIDSRSSSSVE